MWVDGGLEFVDAGVKQRVFGLETKEKLVGLLVAAFSLPGA